MNTGYSESWHRTEHEWSNADHIVDANKMVKPECDLVRRARELQEKQPSFMKPRIRFNAKAPEKFNYD